MLVASLSASHLRDGEVDLATARMVAAHRAPVMLRTLVEAGLATKSGRGRSQRWRLINEPDLIHMRSRAEVEWDRQRNRDNGNTDLTMPVRLRDGDACRWCGRSVNFVKDRKSARGGTYDHLDPGQPGTVETMVVSCKTCNSSRQDNRKEWDLTHQLRPVPTRRHFQPQTIELLLAHGYTRAEMGLEDADARARGDGDRENAHPSGSHPGDVAAPGSGETAWTSSDPDGCRDDEPCEDSARPERTGDAGRGRARTRLAAGTTSPASVTPPQEHAPMPASHRREPADLGPAETPVEGEQQVNARPNWVRPETEPPEWAVPSPAETPAAAPPTGTLRGRSRDKPEKNGGEKPRSEMPQNGQPAGQRVRQLVDPGRSEVSDPGRVGPGREPAPAQRVRRSRRGKRTSGGAS